MPTQGDIEQQQKLLEAHRRTLGVYLEQLALTGRGNVRLEVVHGMRDARVGIAHCKATLRDWGEVIDDHPNDSEPQDDAPDESSGKGVTIKYHPDDSELPIAGTSGSVKLSITVADHPNGSEAPSVRRPQIFWFIILSVGVSALSILVLLVVQRNGILNPDSSPLSPTPIPNFAHKTVRIAFQTLETSPPSPDLSLDQRVERTQQIADWVEEQVTKNPDIGTDSFGVIGPMDVAQTPLPPTSLPQFAHEIGATIVLYGSVSEVNDQGTLNIRLYVSDTTIAEAEELLGDYYLGGPIVYQAPLTSGAIEDTNQEVRRRLQVITAVLFGLGELLEPAGRFDPSRAQQRFDAALTLLQQTGDPPPTTVIPCPSSSQTSTVTVTATHAFAQSTLFVLKGNTALRAKDYAAAQEFYAQAIALSCDNARPYVGLAITTIRQANLTLPATPSQQEIDQYAAALDQAAHYFTLAQEATRRPEAALFRERLHYNQGLWQLSHAGLADTRGDRVATRQALMAARDHFSAVIDAYDQRSPTYRQSRVFTTLAASSLASRALSVSNLDSQNIPQALVDYQRAIDLEAPQQQRTRARLDDPERIAGWFFRIGQLHTMQGDCTDAQIAYQEALRLEPSNGLRQQIQLSLDRLSQECPSPAAVRIQNRSGSSEIPYNVRVVGVPI